MLAEKAKQQEELLTEYENNQGHQQQLEREADTMRVEMEAMKDELQVSYNI